MTDFKIFFSFLIFSLIFSFDFVFGLIYIDVCLKQKALKTQIKMWITFC